MSKTKDVIKKQPQYFSDHFKIDKAKIKELNVFDPILNFDTKVFVEPLLLKKSSSEIIRNSYQTYHKFFANLLLLLQTSKNQDDKCWRTAKRLVDFPEYNYTCIGYSSNSINGSGSGAELNDKILQSAKDIVEAAKNDPEIFLLLTLLEENIAGDRISDMVQNIIDEDICKYTTDIMQKLGLKGNRQYTTKNYNSYSLFANPYSKYPIKLIPKDILLSLPIADDVDSVIEEMTEYNQRLRDIISRDIGNIWYKTTKAYRKEVLLKEVKSNKEFFIETLKALKEYTLEHYDLEKDYEGLYKWLENSQKFINVELSKEVKNCPDNLESLSFAIKAIIIHFQDVIENKEIWRTFWVKCGSDFRHVKEFYSQMLFFTVCNAWLTAIDSNIKIDFIHQNRQIKLKFLISGKFSLIAHIKHANNGSLIKGYKNLLKKYRDSTDIGNFYLIMNFEEGKTKQLKEIKIIENPICNIFEIDVAQRELKKEEKEEDLFESWEMGFNDNFLEVDGFDLQENERYVNEKRKGAKAKNKKTDNIKYQVVKHMFINKRQDNKERKVSEISNSIIIELNKLKKPEFNDFAKKYSISKTLYIEQTLEYLNKKEDGGQISDWCYQIFQGKL